MSKFTTETLPRFYRVAPFVFSLFVCAVFVATQELNRRTKAEHEDLLEKYASMQTENNLRVLRTREQLLPLIAAGEMNLEVGNFKNGRPSYVEAVSSQKALVDKILELEQKDLDYLGVRLKPEGQKLVEQIRSVLGKQFTEEKDAEAAIKEAVELMTQLYAYLSVTSIGCSDHDDKSASKSDIQQRMARMREVARQQLKKLKSLVEELKQTAKFDDQTMQLGVDISEADSEQIDDLLAKCEAVCRASRVLFVLAYRVADDKSLLSAIERPQSEAATICRSLARGLEARLDYAQASQALEDFADSIDRRSRQLTSTAATLMALLGQCELSESRR